MRVLIVSGGKLEVAFLRKRIDAFKPDIIIAADNGISYLQTLRIVPDYIVGDFDTASDELLQKYESDDNILIKRYNPEKDATDTEIAALLAIELSADSVEITGALGGRMDHAIANMHMLYMLAGKGIDAVITDEHNRIRVITQEYRLYKNKQYGKYVSFLPFAGNVRNVSLKGFKYPLNNAVIGYGSSLGVSNEITDECASVVFNEGALIMIESGD